MVDAQLRKCESFSDCVLKTFFSLNCRPNGLASDIKYDMSNVPANPQMFL